MQRLPWLEINGNALTYNREDASATVAFCEREADKGGNDCPGSDVPTGAFVELD